MQGLRFSKNFVALLLADTILLVLAYLIAYIIRFEASFSTKVLQQFSHTVIPIVGFKLIVFFLLGLYKGMWRYTSISDLLNIFKAVFVSSASIIVAILMISRFQGFSRSVFVVDAILTLIFIGGIRLVIRLFLIGSRPNFKFKLHGENICKSEKQKRLLIVGAGDAGEKLVREIDENPNIDYHIVGFVDDMPSKLGRQLRGIKVLGSVDNLPEISDKLQVDEIFIAIPTANGKQMRRIVEQCECADLPYKTLPGMGEIIDGKISIRKMRDISYKDLLGRPPVQLENEKISNSLKDKRVLVTGAGGSIGAELCRQIAQYSPRLMMLLDASENNLYQIQMELKHSVDYPEHIAIIGRVQDKKLMRDLFNKFKPEVVFHAAAYKHVPLMEENPWEAVYSNVIGTQTVVKESVRNNVERFVLVSTDKAVRPTNVMGATKRITEKILQTTDGKNTRLLAVRFGNVIGSSGSVIPLFIQQISKGGPITVTHPEITRFFMTIEEACQLILQAFTMGEGGEIFILEMGTPVKIVDMAYDLIRLAGKEPESDVDIKFTGLRPGEKLYEELITEGEGIVETGHEKIVVLRNGLEGCSAEWLEEKIKQLEVISGGHNAIMIKQKIQEIVPEYMASKYTAVI